MASDVITTGVFVPLVAGFLWRRGNSKGAMAAMVFHRDMPKCTHMGCRLRYFPQAQRWDCPCHGSAFSILGEVRAAPAAEDASISPRQRRQR